MRVDCADRMGGIAQALACFNNRHFSMDRLIRLTSILPKLDLLELLALSPCLANEGSNRSNSWSRMLGRSQSSDAQAKRLYWVVDIPGNYKENCIKEQIIPSFMKDSIAVLKWLVSLFSRRAMMSNLYIFS